MSNKPPSPEDVETLWRTYLTTGTFPGGLPFRGLGPRDVARLFRSIPHGPRCKLCYVPFHGPGGWVARHLLARAPSELNPLVCDICDRFVKRYQGGAEVPLTMLFADVRGSTGLAESMGAAEFSKLINRFFLTAVEVLIHSDALVEKLMGDGIAAFFVPGIAGERHARRGIEAGKNLLRATGHRDASGPWVPVGVGLHTGQAFVGAVGLEGGIADITVLGDTVNIAARLAAEAGAGQLLVSAATWVAAGLDTGAESRRMHLKGRNEPVDALVVDSDSLEMEAAD